MRVLVTNDDGITSPGLHALAGAALDLPAEVMVVAPWDDQSGSGAAVGPLHIPGRVVFEVANLPGMPLVPAYRVRCPPALAVLTAGLGGYGVRPDLVLSGVNLGANLGIAILHSGTVGAALTAANLGLPAVAVSLDADGRPLKWPTAAAVAVEVARWLAARRTAGVLNVNVPNVTLDDLAGVRSATLSRLGSVRTAFTLGDAADERRHELELHTTDAKADRDSDAALVRRGFVTITALSGLAGPPATADGVAEFVEEALAGRRRHSTSTLGAAVPAGTGTSGPVHLPSTFRWPRRKHIPIA